MSEKKKDTGNQKPARKSQQEQIQSGKRTKEVDPNKLTASPIDPMIPSFSTQKRIDAPRGEMIEGVLDSQESKANRTSSQKSKISDTKSKESRSGKRINL
jgi:hypothetical protein